MVVEVAIMVIVVAMITRLATGQGTVAPTAAPHVQRIGSHDYVDVLWEMQVQVLQDLLRWTSPDILKRKCP